MMLSSPPAISKERSLTPSSPNCQALTFQVQNYWFALPLGAIVRIVQGRSSQFGADLPMQLFEGEPLPILDLRVALAEASGILLLPKVMDAIAPDTTALFLLIVRLSSQQYCGLAVDHLPKIQALPLAQCRRLPDFYRHKIANLANYAIVQKSDSATDPSVVFLLELQNLQSCFLPQSTTYIG